MNSVTDRIEKKVFLKAPQARVWQAVSDSKRFGAWFGVTFDAPFTPGARMLGTLTGTMLTIVESGFDAIPLARRADAFEANDEGWAKQAILIEKYLALAPA